MEKTFWQDCKCTQVQSGLKNRPFLFFTIKKGDVHSSVLCALQANLVSFRYIFEKEKFSNGSLYNKENIIEGGKREWGEGIKGKRGEGAKREGEGGQ